MGYGFVRYKCMGVISDFGSSISELFLFRINYAEGFAVSEVRFRNYSDLDG